MTEMQLKRENEEEEVVYAVRSSEADGKDRRS